MDLQKHLQTGWKTTMKFLGPVLLLTVAHLLVTLLSLGILAPVVSAGYVQSLLRSQREGRTPVVKDLFSEMSLFLPLFGLGVLAFLAVGIGFLLFIIPGIALSCLILFACFYLLPLMTDRRLDVREALTCSWRMATEKPVGDHVIILVVYVAILAIGNSLPFVILVAQPLATYIFLSVYEERIAGQKYFIEENTTKSV